MGYTKELFNKIEGFKNISKTLGGDDDLIIAEALKYNCKIGTVTDKESFVHTKGKRTFKEYFNQRSRHLSTSNFYLLKQKIVLTAWHLSNLLVLLSPFLILYSNFFLIPFLIKVLMDIITISILQNRFDYKFRLLDIPFLQIIYEFFQVIHYTRGTFGKIKWK
jgi:cellulose synthase/poly-beta-1,6-N-acetylglucosamine synthase-like glycosyltransferase